MKRQKMLSYAAIALASGLLVAPGAHAQLDYGDYSSATLTSKAWSELGSQNYESALAYIATCLEKYAGEATTMQASLTDFAPTTPPEAASKYWALNDVGACLFIKGEVLMKKGDKAGAKEAFTRLNNEFGFAQCWDTKGWFWKPAEAAKQKLVELEFDQP